MAEFNKNIQTRNGHRLVVRNSQASVKEIFQKYKENLDTIPVADRAKLQSFKRTLDKQEKDIALLDKLIEEATTGDDIEKEIVDKLEFGSILQETICLIEACLNNKAESESVQSAVDHSSTSNEGNTRKKINLPKLQLPVFSGNPMEWLTFWDSFESSIHSDSELQDVDKFQYLRSYLGGIAFSAIDGLAVSNDNYKDAVEVLKSRFGSKQVIISSFMNTLMKLPVVKSADDTKSLRYLYDKTEAVVRSLKGIGTDPSSYGIFVTPVLMAKLPEEFRLQISRKLKENEDTWDLEEILELFGKEVQLREKSTVVQTESATGSIPRRSYQRDFANKSLSTTSALLSSEGVGILKCVLCSGRHVAAKCTTVTDPKVRMKIMKEKGRCFLCFKSGHMSSSCPYGNKCFRCGDRHHIALCRVDHRVYPENSTTDRKVSPEKAEEPQQSSVNVTLSSDHKREKRAILLQTARATISSTRNESLSANVRILFDSGSSKTFVSERAANHLKLRVVGKEKQLIKTFGSTEPQFCECEIVQLTVHCSDGLKVYINAYKIPLICSPLSNQYIDVAKETYPYLRYLPLADKADGKFEQEVDLLIGSDSYWAFVSGNPIKGEGPTAIPTRLGFILNGPVQIFNLPESDEVQSIGIHSVHVLESEAVDTDKREIVSELNKFWDLETLGIKDVEKEPDVYEKFVENIAFKDRKYEVELPMKEDHKVIPDNFSLARNRLMSLLKRLKNQPDVLKKYDAVIQEQLSAGVIELVEENVVVETGNVHTLPHREVIRENKDTTKLRVIYDASSKRQGEVSLNDCMNASPALVPLIFDVFMRFRLNLVALVGDLEKAFLNIQIKPEDRDLLCFLWVKDINVDNPEIITLRFTRLVFGLIGSPFVLNATIRYHMEKYRDSDPAFVDNVKNSTYIDDYASSTASEGEAFELYKKLKSRFKEGGFNMRK